MMNNLLEKKECRICFTDDNQDNFINPCRCSGTSKWVHKECLSQWRSLSTNPEAYTKCMECNTNYNFRQENEEIKLCESSCLYLTSNLFLFIILNEFLIFILSSLLIIFDKGVDNLKYLFTNDIFDNYSSYFLLSSLIYFGFIILFFIIHFILIKNKKLYIKYYWDIGKKTFLSAIILNIVFYVINVILGIITYSFTISLFIRFHYLIVDKINRTGNQIILPYNENIV